MGDHNVNSFYRIDIGFSNDTKEEEENSFCTYNFYVFIMKFPKPCFTNSKLEVKYFNGYFTYLSDHLTFLWKIGCSKTEVIGCGIDTISRTIVLTRNGKPVHCQFYLAGPLYWWEAPPSLQPTVHISPNSMDEKDLFLPSIKLTINFGNSPFEYKKHLKELFQYTISKEQKFSPPKVSREYHLCTISC